MRPLIPAPPPPWNVLKQKQNKTPKKETSKNKMTDKGVIITGDCEFMDESLESYMSSVIILTRIYIYVEYVCEASR